MVNIGRHHHLESINLHCQIHRPRLPSRPNAIAESQQLQQCNQSQIQPKLTPWFSGIEENKSQQRAAHHIHPNHQQKQFSTARKLSVGVGIPKPQHHQSRQNRKGQTAKQMNTCGFAGWSKTGVRLYAVHYGCVFLRCIETKKERLSALFFRQTDQQINGIQKACTWTEWQSLQLQPCCWPTHGQWRLRWWWTYKPSRSHLERSPKE